MRGKPLFLGSIVLALAVFPPTATALYEAHDPSPTDGATGVEPNPVLSWSPGDDADVHHIFLGTNFDCVNDGNLVCWEGAQADPDTDYTTPMLMLGTTYFWRIEEVDTDYPGRVTHGQTWSFAVTEYIIVDDMEPYNDTNNPIWDTWTDGCGDANGQGSNGTGSCVFLETGTVHTDAKSMQYFYDNCMSDCEHFGCYSEARRIFDTPQNWALTNEKALVLWFYGNRNNENSEMWVVLDDDITEDMSLYGAEGDDPEDIKKEEWIDWNIDLRDFSDAGLDLSNIASISIGFGSRTFFEPGGIGVVYFDDIRLYPRRCILKYGPAADLSGNCIVDLPDIKIIADQWLHTDNITADLYPDNIVNLKDYAVPADSWLEQQLWPAP